MIEEFTANGYTVRVEPDTDVTKENDDPSCFIVTTNNRYFSVEGPNGETAGSVGESMAEWEETHNVYPLYALIHGGVVLSVTSDMKEYYMGFDSGQIGFVLVTKNSGEIPDPFGYAKEMVEVWNQYLSGDVWGYTVTAPDGEEVSCWGIYGFDAAIQEALSEVGKP